MTRKEIYQLIKDGVDRLKLPHEFGRGRISEFSSTRDHNYPIIWFETSPMSTSLSQNSMPIDAWPIRLHIGRLDKEDSKTEQYEYIIDECDLIAQALSFIYNSVVTNSTFITIDSINREPFIKKHADSVTGVLLSFTLTGPDTTDQSENCD